MLHSFKKVMLFPYSKELLAVYRFRDQLPFEICSVVSFKSWGYVEKNCGSIDGGEPGTHVVKGDFTSELSQVDSVILGSFSKYFGDKDVRNKYLMEIYQAGKNVLVLEPMAEEEISKYRTLFREKGLEFVVLDSSYTNDDMTSLISTPVLGVFASGQDTGKLEMQLKLYRALKNAGYRISMIGANPQIVLLGGYAYPFAIYQNSFGENQKIKILRSFANMIIRREMPDVLIISAPYGMNNFEEDRWGIDEGKNGLLAHIIIEALKPDANIFCFNSGDPGWSKRALNTLEALSLAPTLAAATKRFMCTPIKAYERFKYSLLDDEMFQLHLDKWKENLHPMIIDLDKAREEELLQLVLNAFDAEQRLEMIL